MNGTTKRGLLILFFALNASSIFLFFGIFEHRCINRYNISTAYDEKNQNILPSCRDSNFTIVVLTMNRAQSLQRLLKSLQETDFDGDKVNLVINIDFSKDNQEVQKVSRSFNFNHGCKKVNVYNESKGLAMSWFTAWSPRHENDYSIILEDDLEVASSIWYLWLKRAWRAYGKDKNAKNEISGISLCRQLFRNRVLTNKTDPYLYPMPGSHGFSPSPKKWQQFINWINSIDIFNYDLTTPGIGTSDYWKSLKTLEKKKGMWTQHFIYFTVKNNLCCLYKNPMNGKALVSHWREKGVHFKNRRGKIDHEIADVIDFSFPSFESLERFGWNGSRIDSQSK